MNTYRIMYTAKKMWPIVIRYEADAKWHAQAAAMHLKDTLAQMGIIKQGGVKTTVNLEFRKGKKVRHFSL